MTAPPLESARLALRGHTLADLDEYVALWSDPEVTRHVGGVPFTPDEIWARLQRNVGHWQLMAFGYWIARDRATGRLVGDVGVAEHRRAIVPPLDGPEAGWVLAPWASGRGLATEAMAAVLAWTDAHVDAPHTTCIIEPGHARSIRVADKLGFRPAPDAAFRGHRTLVFARPRPG